jgi:hypothetical protein
MEKLRFRNNWVRCRMKLSRCMYIIKDSDLVYLDDNNIEETIGMEIAIIILQLFKDKYFINGNPYLLLENCVKPILEN